jgi:ABC-2 type transport system ATP-binding protein
VLRTLGLREAVAAGRHYELRVDVVTGDLLERLRPHVDEWRFLDDAEEATRAASDGACPEGGAWPTTLELITDEARIPLIARATVAAGARLYALTPRRTSLEQLFLDIVGTEDSGQ